MVEKIEISIKVDNERFNCEMVDRDGKKWNGTGLNITESVCNLMQNIEIKAQKDKEKEVLKLYVLNYDKAVKIALFFGKSLGEEAKLLDFTPMAIHLKTNINIVDIVTQLNFLKVYGIVSETSKRVDVSEQHKKFKINWSVFELEALKDELKTIEERKKIVLKKIEIASKHNAK